LNRIDEIVIFNYLGKTEIEKIVDLELDKVVKRLKNRNINLVFSDSLKVLLTNKGFNPSFGARPLKRVIQKLVLDPLSLKIVIGEIKDGSTIIVDSDNDKVVFSEPKRLSGKIKKK
jgi:ATP-dependent Clp protease ATP-binding subunit ClpA